MGIGRHNPCSLASAGAPFANGFKEPVDGFGLVRFFDNNTKKKD